MQGSGNAAFWGFSPALDLLSDDPSKQQLSASLDDVRPNDEGDQDTPLNILLCGSHDPRHIITTLSRLRRHPKRPVHFYIMEKTPESLSRQLLLLAVYIDTELGGHYERVQTWLEIFGNSKVQKRTAEYIDTKAKELINLVTNEKGPLADIVDFDLMKFSDRDDLEETMQTWRTNHEFKTMVLHKTNILSSDDRLRALYKERYDVRKNMIDWDYQMRLKELASIIHIIHYREFRETGVAFEARECQYTDPNRTLGSMLPGKIAGKAVKKRGFWCDIINSPYISFGIEADEPKLFKVRSDQHVKTSVDVSEYNLLSLMQEFEGNGKYTLPKDWEGPDSEVAEGLKVMSISEDGEKQPLLVSDRVRIFPLCGEPPVLLKKKRFRNLFNKVFLGMTSVHNIVKEIAPLLADDCSVTVESAKYMVEVKKEVATEFVAKVSSLAQGANWTPKHEAPNPPEDAWKLDWMRYVVPRAADEETV